MPTDHEVTLEYIGPPNQERFREGTNEKESLVPGRRYQMSQAMAEENLQPHNSTHWKRPDTGKAAAKE